MKSCSQYLLRTLVFFSALAAILAGCVNVPQTPRSTVDLTALKLVVTLVRAGMEEGMQIPEQTPYEVREEDRIEVDEGGRARLRFPNHVIVELFRQTGVLVPTEPMIDPQVSIFLQLKLEHGTARAELYQEANARIDILTDYAILRAVEPNSEFVACHNPQLTCVVALQGEMEVEAAGRVVKLERGESSYIFPGQPPTPPICADLEQIDQWLGSKRGTEPVVGLGAIVAQWPQVSCSAITSAPSTSDPSTSDPSTSDPSTPDPTGLEANEMPVSPCPGFHLLNPKDGAEYVHVPGGEFTMGADAESAISPLEQPQHTATVQDFWIQCTEVTNEQYGRCVAAGACMPPTNDDWDDPERARYPVTHVNWQRANDYADWAGGRLPSEAEWEKACRSTDGRTYAWGSDPPTAELANYGDAIGESTPVGSYPTGAGPYGTLDMNGNVWEWTASLERAYPYRADEGRENPDDDGKRIARGGSFYYTQHQLTCTARSGFSPNTANEYYGFRVVLSP